MEKENTPIEQNDILTRITALAGYKGNNNMFHVRIFMLLCLATEDFKKALNYFTSEKDDIFPRLEKIIERMDADTSLFKLFLGLCYITDDFKKALHIFENRLFANFHEISNWEELKEIEVMFAEQVLDAFPENHNETKNFLDEIEPLEGKELEDFFMKKRKKYFIKELGITFNILDEENNHI